MTTLDEIEKRFAAYPDWAEPEHAFVADIMHALRASEARRLEQASQIMELQADLSTERARYENLWHDVEQLARDCDGHNMCWRNTERFLEKVGLRQKLSQMPPRDEFEMGCKRFQDEVYSNPQRWPDFFELITSGSK